MKFTVCAFLLLFSGLCLSDPRGTASGKPATAPNKDAKSALRQRVTNEYFVQALHQLDIAKATAALNRGADINSKGLWPNAGCVSGMHLASPQEGVSILDYYNYSPNTFAVIKWLLENGSRPEPSVFLSFVMQGKTEYVKLYLLYKADPNDAADTTQNPLEWAEAGLTGTIKKIAEVGPDKATEPYRHPMAGIKMPPLITQKENLEKIIQMLKDAGAVERKSH